MNTETIAVAPAASRLHDLYRQHGPRALGLAYLLTGDWHQAEDLVQEAFVRVAGRFQHLRDAAGFEAYLRRAVVNLHRSLLRRKRVERAYLLRQRGVRAADEDSDIETQDELIRALRRLPTRQRAAVVLRYCLDLSEAQVAEELRCSPGAAKNLVARGIRALREQLGGQSDG
jgi:RNA polymerase sigma-70 factor (sigma-E family)